MPTAPSGPVSGIVLGARSNTTDPMFDATFYNHYSFLRPLEDLFAVAKASPGLDGKGHLGFAAQPGLKAFGTDVFNHK